MSYSGPKLAVSPSNNILTPGQLVIAVTLQHQARGRVAARVPVDRYDLMGESGEQTTDVPLSSHKPCS